MDVPEPGPNEVRIKVEYGGICGTDLHIWQDGSYPIKPPVVIGHELSGLIDKSGSDSNKYKVGDRVVSETYFYTCGTCGYCRTGHANLCLERLSIGSGVDGVFAEYVVVPEKNIHKIPENISLQEAALCEPLACCVQAVYEFTDILPEDWVVVTGPGTIGLLCLEVLNSIGCKTIMLGTEKDKERLELAKKLGASYTFFVSDENLQEKINSLTNENGIPFAFECSGAEAAIDLCIKLVRKGATLVQVGLTGKKVLIDANIITLKELSYQGTFAQKWKWWDKALTLMEAGKLELEPLITDVLALDDWKTGFNKSLNNDGFKILLKP
jgi:L-iditol 2-dehydrogenase